MIPFKTWITLLLAVLLFSATAALPASAASSYDRITCINGVCSSTSFSSGYNSWNQYYWPSGYGYYYPPYTGPYYHYRYPSYDPGYSPSYWGPYRTYQYDGYLCAGQYRVYCFRMGGQRSYIEWIVNSNCYGSTDPVMMSMGPDAISTFRDRHCGADFDLYVYQNTQPYPYNHPDRVDVSSGSNAYVGWRYPCSGCYYCVVVYCKSGCGSYRLTCNSYNDWSWYPYYTPATPAVASSYYGSDMMASQGYSAPGGYAQSSYGFPETDPSMPPMMAGESDPAMDAALDEVMYSGEEGVFVPDMGDPDTTSFTWVGDESQEDEEGYADTGEGMYYDPLSDEETGEYPWDTEPGEWMETG